MIDARCNCGAVALSLYRVPETNRRAVRRRCLLSGGGRHDLRDAEGIRSCCREWRQGPFLFLRRLRLNGLLESRQSAGDDRRCRRRDSRPRFPSSDQVGFRTVETCLGRDQRRWRRASSTRQCAQDFRLSAPHQALVPAEGIEPPTFGLQNRCSTAELSRRRLAKAGRGRHPPGCPPGRGNTRLGLKVPEPARALADMNQAARRPPDLTRSM
jgi:hypothetical protein